MSDLRLVHLLLVGAGGFVGSVARFASAAAISRFSGGAFPWGTLTVNVAGCLLIGLLAGGLEARQLMATQARLLLIVGLLGGFTTFSAFGLETLELLREARWGAAGSYVAASLLLGVFAVWAGHAVGKLT